MINETKYSKKHCVNSPLIHLEKDWGWGVKNEIVALILNCSFFCDEMA